MEHVDVLERDINRKYDGEDLEEITIRLIKAMLEEKVPMEDIQHITKKSVEEIKKIGELSD